MSSLYDLDPKTRELLTVDTFLKQTTVKDFVESLTANHAIQESNGQGTALEPKPYIRTFEASLNALVDINADLSSQEERLKADTSNAKLVHQKNVSNNLAQCYELTNKFSELDLLISDIASTITTLGDTMNLITRQRNRAVSSGFVIKCYLAFLNDDYEIMENLRKGSVEDQRQCAITVRQLLRLARKIFRIPKADLARQNIEKYAEMVERELLKSFDRAYRSANLDAMKSAADILTEFNGGTSVIQMFVNQHDFFIMKEKLLQDSAVEDIEFWQKLADPDCENLPFDYSTKELLDDIGQTVKKETTIIRRVFSHPENVLRVFLQRLFAQSIQQRIELILSHASSISALAYLRALQDSHLLVNTLVTELKGYLQPELEDTQSVVLLLDLSLQDLFVPYIENGLYIEKEKRSLHELFTGAFWKFTNFYAQKKPITKSYTILDRFQLQSSSSDSDKTEKSRIATLRLRLARNRGNNDNSKDKTDNATTNNSGNSSGNINQQNPNSIGQTVNGGQSNVLAKKQSAMDQNVEISESDQEIRLEDVTRYIKWVEEAIERDMQLRAKTEIAKDVCAILTVLVDCLGRSYLEVALNYALEKYHGKAQDKNYQATLRSCSQVLSLISETVRTTLNQLEGFSIAARSPELSLPLLSYVNSAEEKINRALK
ncbi:exocyst complex component Sec10-like protein [Dipodascopsis uninucleata]